MFQFASVVLEEIKQQMDIFGNMRNINLILIHCSAIKEE